MHTLKQTQAVSTAEGFGWNGQVRCLVTDGVLHSYCLTIWSTSWLTAANWWSQNFPRTGGCSKQRKTSLEFQLWWWKRLWEKTPLGNKWSGIAKGDYWSKELLNWTSKYFILKFCKCLVAFWHIYWETLYKITCVLCKIQWMKMDADVSATHKQVK